MNLAILSGILLFSLEYLGDTLRNVKAPWSPSMQGLCHDDEFLFVTQKDRLWRIPRHTPFDPRHAADTLDIPDELAQLGANHMGDCDTHQGRVYIPLEGTRPLKLLLVDAKSMQVLSAPDLDPSQTNAPWVTVDQASGTVWSGPFDLTKEKQILGYRLSEDLQSLAPEKYLELKTRIYRIQAAELVASRGVFWILSDKVDGGLFGFDSKTGQLLHQRRIQFSPKFPKLEELEGLDALEDGEAGLMNFPGNLFVSMWNKNLFSHRTYLKSFRF